ncbi:MAG: WHG domain-containing protein [Acidimicrobiia bacterium]|nr:WHG domain-containing protein [Acidimicrobiia bacterium]
MHREGFTRLHTWLDSVPADLDPGTRLRALGHAYQDAALAQPALYVVMFERPDPSFEPTDADRQAALAGAEVLIEATKQAVDTGVLHDPRGDPERLAVRLWAINHGITSLAIAGMLGGRDCLDPRGGTRCRRRCRARHRGGAVRSRPRARGALSWCPGCRRCRISAAAHPKSNTSI